MLWSESDTEGALFVELVKDEQGATNAEQLSNLWREETGTIPGVKELTFSSGNNAGGSKPVFFRLTGNNPEELRLAANELEQYLNTYEGLFDIENSVETPTDELVLDILPSAQALGLNLAQLGNQIRQGFYGEEVQRIQRGQEEVRVMLRYPKEERNDLTDLQRVRIRTSDGNEVPFYQVASVTQGEGTSYIRRTDGKRSLAISADLNNEELESSTVIKEVREHFKPILASTYPSVSFAIAGASKAQQDSMTQLASLAMIAMILIYGLIAIPLKSYLQPLVIMGIIPFGLVGAVIGHLLLGLQLTMMSIFGLIALAGVLVNDSLILMDFINQGEDRECQPWKQPCRLARERFRAIILTSLTTFLGLVPITLEPSLQAQFVIPMAVSLGFGDFVRHVYHLDSHAYVVSGGRDMKAGYTVAVDGRVIHSTSQINGRERLSRTAQSFLIRPIW